MRILQRTVIAAVFSVVCSLSVLAQSKQPPAHPLDLNVANVKEVEQVPGIGPKAAPGDRGFQA